MERRVTVKTKILAIAAIALVSVLPPPNAAAQELSFQRKIRLPLWAQLDAYPGLEKPDYDAGVFDYAIRQMKAITPFLLNGMVYGWEFDYTPSDRLRGVPEYFEAKEIRSFEAESKKIFYEQPWFDQSKVHCWANFERDEGMVQSWNQWADVKNPRIMGIGGGKVSKGFEGIQEAAQNALKDAVRNYYRKILKNKPKQITGRVLINKIPAILINSGEYQLQLDFFLETGIIKEYQNF
ncbi:MAG: hypothetical protein VZQ47_05000 [Treponema sp.]|nr:hypothetical protein [Treponema sp.]MEE3434891.1 hypothetical protein [Treponema sp.]